MKFFIDKRNNEELFYINNAIDESDDSIAELCGFDENSYKKIMLKQFNAVLFHIRKQCICDKIHGDAYIFFTKIEDAEKAILWIESMMVMNKLSR